MAEVILTVNDFASAGAEEGVKAAIVATMVRIHAQAVSLVPVDTGQLKGSLMWRKGWTNDAFSFPASGGYSEGPKIEAPSGIVGSVGTAVNHGIYQEFGTRKMQAQPYLRPAGDAVRGADASAIARKWGADAMAAEFKRRKTTRLSR